MAGVAAAVSRTPPLCSVCIANYNGIGMIDACIESVLNQDWGKAVEIIVHDDASTDGSAEYICTRYPSVKLIASLDNVGFCIANNRMAAMAQGKFLLLLNNDAMLLPDALRHLHEYAAKLATPAILGLPQYDAESGCLLDMGSLLDPFLNPIPNLDPERSEVGMIMGACLWIPKGLWVELGGFPEWMKSIGEDLYLCCRARLSGYPVICLDQSGYRHRVGISFGGGRVQAGRLSTTFRRRSLSERNKSFTIAVCYPPLALMFLLPLHLLLLSLEGLALCLLKCDTRFWTQIYGPCLGDMWRKRRMLRHVRQQVQTSRPLRTNFFSTFVVTPYKLKMLWRYGLPDVTLR